MAEQILNPIALDFNDLAVYDKKIKEYIDEKASANLSDIDDKVAEIVATISAHDAKIISLQSEVDENEADIIRLEDEDKKLNNKFSILSADIERKADISALDNYITISTFDHHKEDFDKEIARLDTELKEITSFAYKNHEDIDSINIKLENKSNEGHKHHLSDITDFSLEGYATEDYVDSKIEEIVHPSMDHLATKAELLEVSNRIPTKVSQLQNDNEYITKQELDSKGFITEHQSLENYATKEFVTNSISNIDIPDTSNFITMKDVEAKNYLTEIPSYYITESELDAKGYITDVSNFATHEEVQEAVSAHVEEEIETTIKNNIQDEVATQLAQNETIQYGTFGEI